jgi:FkbM family methyltransferase
VQAILELCKRFLRVLNDAILALRTCQNWYDALAVRFGLKDKAKIIYRNGIEYLYERSNESAIWAHRLLAHVVLNGLNADLVSSNKIRLWMEDTTLVTELDREGYLASGYMTRLAKSGCHFPGNGIIRLPNNLLFKYPSSDLSAFCHIWDTFFEETYGLLDVKGKTVVDVGASFGDTPIYFASRGAAKVYAYEPLQELFPYLKENIVANNFEDRIFPACMAVSNEAYVYMKPNSRWYGKSSVRRTANGTGYRVHSEPLLLNADILKMDCEGCEYEAFSRIEPTSLRYREIMIEFHNGSSPLLVILSAAGYRVRIIREYARTSGQLYASLKH